MFSSFFVFCFYVLPMDFMHCNEFDVIVFPFSQLQKVFFLHFLFCFFDGALLIDVRNNTKRKVKA